MKDSTFLTDTKIPLIRPLITGTGETLTELVMRVPTRGDMRKAQRHSKEHAESETFLFALLTGLTMEDIDTLTLADNAEVMKTFRSLCGESTNES